MESKIYDKVIKDYKKNNIDLKTVLRSDGGLITPKKTIIYKYKVADTFAIDLNYLSILRAFDTDFNNYICNHNSNCESDNDTNSDPYSDIISDTESESDSN
jgi:hypothetical protein